MNDIILMCGTTYRVRIVRSYYIYLHIIFSHTTNYTTHRANDSYIPYTTYLALINFWTATSAVTEPKKTTLLKYDTYRTISSCGAMQARLHAAIAHAVIARAHAADILYRMTTRYRRAKSRSRLVVRCAPTMAGRQ